MCEQKIISEFDQFYNLLFLNQVIQEVKETLFEIKNSKVVFLYDVDLDKDYIYKEFKAHYEIQINITKSDIVLGYPELLKNLKLFNAEIINKYVISLRNKAYLFFTSHDVKSIIGILTLTKGNLKSSIQSIAQQDKNIESKISGVFYKGKLLV